MNSTSMTAVASRRVFAKDPIAPLAKRRTAALLSATSTVGGEAAGSRVDAAPTTTASPTSHRARS